MINDGDCGACFDNDDAQGLANYICWLAENSDMQQKHGRNARKLLETKYTIDQAVPQYIEALGIAEASFEGIPENHLRYTTV
jgi:glycosyltransferase involved in cell wall biosynthesis